MNSSRAVGVMLAGGRSSRMGSPKGVAILGGRPLAERGIEVLREALDDVVIVTNEPGLYERFDAVLIGDDYPGRGPLAGIEAGLRWALDAGAPGIVCLPCDAPFADAELIRRVVDRSDRVDAVIPRSGGPLGYEPLFGWYSVANLKIAVGCLDGGRSTMTDFIESLPSVGYIPVDEIREIADPDVLFLNVNTPDDLERARGIEASRRLASG